MKIKMVPGRETRIREGASELIPQKPEIFQKFLIAV